MVKLSVLNNYLNGKWEDLDKNDLLNIVDYFETYAMSGKEIADLLIICDLPEN
jgi:hypothetical protein